MNNKKSNKIFRKISVTEEISLILKKVRWLEKCKSISEAINVMYASYLKDKKQHDTQKIEVGKMASIIGFDSDGCFILQGTVREIKEGKVHLVATRKISLCYKNGAKSIIDDAGEVVTDYDYARMSLEEQSLKISEFNSMLLSSLKKVIKTDYMVSVEYQ